MFDRCIVGMTGFFDVRHFTLRPILVFAVILFLIGVLITACGNFVMLMMKYKEMSMKKFGKGLAFVLAIAFIVTFTLSACGSKKATVKENNTEQSMTGAGEAWEEDTESMMQMRIGDTAVAVEWEDNESVQALRDLCADNPLTIKMSKYGGFEQVGSIGRSLPRNDRQTTTGVGDIVLYSGNQIVVFYGSNS